MTDTPNNLVRSGLPGIVWPGVPNHPGPVLLALQYQYGQSEWWPPEKLEAAQLLQAGELVRHAYENVPFHRRRLDDAGYDPACPLTWERLRALPRMTRVMAQEEGEALLCRNFPPAHGRAITGQTSGSTGSPLTYYGTELTQVLWQALTLRDHLWHRRDFAGKLAAIRPHIDDGEQSGWGPSTDVIFAGGRCVRKNIRVDLDEQLAWLVREEPDYFISQADNVYALARRSLEQGVKIPGLREARCYGSALRPDARELVRAAWEVPLTDVYTAEEIGYIALQCPDHPHYHVQSENVLVEVLDEAGKPCVPGETGKVALTALHNFAMPLIRYEIGDYAEAGARCACGRGLPVLNRILGRQRNMLVLPDGTRRWPSFPSSHWSTIAPIRQLQLVQKSPSAIQVRVVALRPLSAGERSALIAAFQETLGYPFDIEVIEVAEIPRHEGGKFEDFMSEVR